MTFKKDILITAASAGELMPVYAQALLSQPHITLLHLIMYRAEVHILKNFPQLYGSSVPKLPQINDFYTCYQRVGRLSM